MKHLARFLAATFAAVHLLLAVSAPAHAAWLRAESENFVVYGDMGEARLREQIVTLEDYNALLRLLTGTSEAPSPNKLHLYLVRGIGELRQVRPVSSIIAGFYTATPYGIGAFADISSDGRTNEVVFHEYAHHFMHQYHSTAYPNWYVEGFAEFMMTARFTERNVEFGHASRMRVSWLSDRSTWLPLETVMFQSAEIGSSAGLARYYAQSWVLTHYILNDPARAAQLRSYVGALNRGQEPRAAFAASFGKTPAELQRELQTYAFRGLTFRRMDRASIARTPQIEITRLPPSADDLVLLEAALRIDGHEPAALLARARQQAARHPGDALAKRILAHAEALHGDGEVAQRLLTELLAATPNDVELLYLRGMRDLVAGERDAEARPARFRQARIWFARAHRVNDRHFPTLYRYVQTFTQEPAFISDNNSEVLLLAHTLAPQVPEIRMNAAAMLLARGEFDLAASLIRPLASTAHESGYSGIARALLAKALARDNGGVGLTFTPPPEPAEERAPPPRGS
jgi:Flp pilus assembly protein TadD